MSDQVIPNPLKLVLLATAFLAAYFDLRVRRIPNWINVSAALLGLGLNTYLENRHGALLAAGGLLVALCIYLPLYALKGMGAGDVKLMAAIGAIVGPGNWFTIFIATALLGGVAALVLVLLRRKMGQTLLNVATILAQLAKGKPPAERDTALSIHDNKSLKMPHGAIIASGVFLFLAVHWKT
jgi:prepilin peptidase CpaA